MLSKGFPAQNSVHPKYAVPKTSVIVRRQRVIELTNTKKLTMRAVRLEN